MLTSAQSVDRDSPPQDAAEQRGVQAFWRREASLHLADGHLVLGGGAEQTEAAGHRAEDVRREVVTVQQQVLVLHSCGRAVAEGGVVKRKETG